MTPHPQPEQRWTGWFYITKGEWDLLSEKYRITMCFEELDLMKEIRSRPYNPATEWDKVLRPEVLTFALLMERKLRKHDTERGDSYKTSNVDYLLMRLREEVKELHNVIEDDPWNGKGVSLGEAVDVGNIAMMVGYHDYQFPMDAFISELVAELRSTKGGSP